MEYKVHFDSSTFPWWSGAVDTVAEIRKAHKIGELQDFLEEYYIGKTPTMTDINDLLWFYPDMVYKCIGMEVEDE